MILIREWEQQMSSSGCCGRLEGDVLLQQGVRCFPERRETMEEMGPLYRALRERWADEIATMWAEQLPGSEPSKRAHRASVRSVAARFLALVLCELERPSMASEQVDATACL